MLYLGDDVIPFSESGFDPVENLVRFGSDGVVMVTVGDVHEFGRFAAFDSLHEFIDAVLGEDVELSLDFSVDLVPHKDIDHSSAKRDDERQLVGSRAREGESS